MFVHAAHIRGRDSSGDATEEYARIVLFLDASIFPETCPEQDYSEDERVRLLHAIENSLDEASKNVRIVTVALLEELNTLLGKLFPYLHVEGSPPQKTVRKLDQYLQPPHKLSRRIRKKIYGDGNGDLLKRLPELCAKLRLAPALPL